MTAEETKEGSPKKEAAVLSEASLSVLAKELGDMSLKVCMYMNVPTVTLINLQLAAEEKNKADEDTWCTMLLQWKNQRSCAKEKEKVTELERALRDNDKPEMADALADRFRENAELTADAFTH